MTKQKLRLTDKRTSFKPFAYPWAYEAWLEHEKIHWLHTEVPLHEDAKEWNSKLTESERTFLTNLFRFFTQGDIDVAGAYVNNYMPIFPQPEIRMMLCGFAAREALHIAAYSHLIETLGMPETVYNEFLEYQAMLDKHEYTDAVGGLGTDHLAEQIAVFSAFTEGLQLFSTFVMLLNFPRKGKMKGMGQIVSWSIIDETCLAGDTEVLTISGWKPIQHITTDDAVAQYDLNTTEVTFVNPLRTVKSIKDHSFVFEGDDFHQHVTGDHRMIVDGGEVLAKDATGNEVFITAGTKNGVQDVLTDNDRLAIDEILSGQRDVQWIYDQIPNVTSDWAEAAVTYYLSVSY